MGAADYAQVRSSAVIVTQPRPLTWPNIANQATRHPVCSVRNEGVRAQSARCRGSDVEGRARPSESIRPTGGRRANLAVTSEDPAAGAVRLALSA
jgi:hypothetical protein